MQKHKKAWEEWVWKAAVRPQDVITLGRPEWRIWTLPKVRGGSSKYLYQEGDNIIFVFLKSHSSCTVEGKREMGINARDNSLS